MLKNRFYYLAAALLMSSTFVACDDDEGGNPDTDTGTDVPLDEDIRTEPEYSYLSSIAFPTVDEDSGEVDCCANLNDEEGIDNALAEILPLVVDLVGEDVDVDALLQGVIDDGSLILIFEHEGLPVDIAGNADFTINVYVGASEDDAETRANGGGTFTLEQQVATISGAEYRGGTVNATADELILSLDLGALGLGDDLPLDAIDLPLTPAIIFANVEEDAEGGIATADAEAYLTGGVGVGFVADIVNGLATECGTPESNLGSGDVPLLYVEETAGEATASIGCNYDPTDENGEGLDIDDENTEDGTLCDGTIMGIVCSPSLGGLLGGFLDVDTNDNDILDGISLGLFIEFAGGVEFNAAE